jgi:single-strand DNA-binding protein
MATTESYWDKEKSARVELPTEWHNIRITRPGLIKIAQQYLHKGSQVYIEGSLRTRQYQTKEGETKYFTEVSVNDMVLTGVRPNGDSGAASVHAEMSTPIAVPASVGDDDLPF